MLNHFNGIADDVGTTIGPLIGDIVEDIQTLFRQELALAQSELKIELDRARTAALTFGAAVLATFFAGILGCLTLTYLLAWLVPTLPIWACYGCIFLIVTFVSIGLFVKSAGAKKRIDIIPKKTLKSLKETTRWATNKI